MLLGIVISAHHIFRNLGKLPRFAGWQPALPGFHFRVVLSLLLSFPLIEGLAELAPPFGKFAGSALGALPSRARLRQRNAIWYVLNRRDVPIECYV